MSNIRNKDLLNSNYWSNGPYSQPYWPNNVFYGQSYWPNGNYWNQRHPWNNYRWHPHQNYWSSVNGSYQNIWPFQTNSGEVVEPDQQQGNPPPVQTTKPPMQNYDTFLAEVEITDPKLCQGPENCTFYMPMYKPKQNN
jgi:hypothetical protein